ncbi:hypothetical protein M5K25_005922 [Dendrobium thyrsiflorum]|uniref:Uncharacterized protein n=1 Tax=Dendrobium thyrsiflorum TaxID=117978 RepID=A0ABD0VH35_DENTH
MRNNWAKSLPETQTFFHTSPLELTSVARRIYMDELREITPKESVPTKMSGFICAVNLHLNLPFCFLKFLLLLFSFWFFGSSTPFLDDAPCTLKIHGRSE